MANAPAVQAMKFVVFVFRRIEIEKHALFVFRNHCFSSSYPCASFRRVSTLLWRPSITKMLSAFNGIEHRHQHQAQTRPRMFSVAVSLLARETNKICRFVDL